MMVTFLIWAGIITTSPGLQSAKPIEKVDRVIDQKIMVGFIGKTPPLHPIERLSIDTSHKKSSVASAYLNGLIGGPIFRLKSEWNWECLPCGNGEFPIVRKVSKKDKDKTFSALYRFDSGFSWGDGEPITGLDFKFSWQVGLSKFNGMDFSSIYQQITDIQVSPENRREFRVFFRSGFGRLARLEGFRLIPKHLEYPIWKQSRFEYKKYFKKSLYVRKPLNPGLYYGEFIPTKITRNPIEFRSVGDKKKQTRIQLSFFRNRHGLKKNIQRIHIVPEMNATIENLNRIKTEDHFLLSDGKPQVGALFFNLRNPVLHDVRLRTALFHSIDVRRLFSEVLIKEAIPARSFLAKGEWNVQHQDSSNGFESGFSLAKSKMLLDQSGWLLRDKKRMKMGKVLDLELAIDDSPVSKEIAKILIEDWARLSVGVKLKVFSKKVYHPNILRQSRFLGMALTTLGTPAGWYPEDVFGAEQIPKKRNAYVGSNIMSWVSRPGSKILKKMLVSKSIIPGAKDRKYMQDLMDLVATEKPIIPLFHPLQGALVHQSLAGFKLPGHRFSSIVSVKDWHFR